MSEETPVRQYRKIQPDRDRLPSFAKVMTVLSAIQVLLALVIHISAYASPLLLAILATVIIVMTIIAGYVWDDLRAFRVAVRWIGLLAVLALVVLGVIQVMPVFLSPDTSGDMIPFAIAENGTLLLMFLQLLLVFSLPLSVVAASFGGGLDRWIMRVIALLNAACVLYFVLYGFTNISVLRAFDLMPELPMGLYAYAGFSVVVAGLAFVPAIYSGRAKS